MTLPGDLWSFAGVNLQQDTMRVRAIDGFASVPPMRGTGSVRSAIPGELFRGKVHGARVIGLEILLFSYTSDLSGIFSNFDLLAKIFNTQYQTEQPLVHFHPDGSVRTALAHCVSFPPKPSDDNTGLLWSGTAEFLMSDPYFYTPLQHVSGASGTFVVNHPGTVRTHRIVFTISGTNSVTVTNNTNNVSFTVAWPGTHTFTVDCRAFTVLVDVTSEAGALTHSGDLPFMVFEPGDNSITISGGTTDIDWYPAYI